MKKSTSATSGIVYYHLENCTLECHIKDECITILYSYKVMNDDDKRDVLADLLESFPWFKEHRTVDDMFYEWKTHNILYEWNVRPSSTIHTDMELKQSRFLKFCYKVFAKIFKEKK